MFLVHFWRPPGHPFVAFREFTSITSRRRAWARCATPAMTLSASRGAVGEVFFFPLIFFVFNVCFFCVCLMLFYVFFVLHGCFIVFWFMEILWICLCFFKWIFTDWKPP
jgi:hypothetical protein